MYSGNLPRPRTLPRPSARMCHSSSSSLVSFVRVLLALLALAFLLSGLGLLCATLWLRFDPHFERQVRATLLSDPALAPSELADTKMEFRLAYLIIFWALTGLASGLALIGFVGLCASCSHSRPVCAMLCLLLVLLILLQLLAFLGIGLFRNGILDRLGSYISVSHQYNLTDATVIRERFGCCGDGNYQMSYNYQCQGLGQPNCRQMLEQWFGTALTGTAIFVAVLVGAELIALALSGVLICNRKYRTLDEGH